MSEADSSIWSTPDPFLAQSHVEQLVAQNRRDQGVIRSDLSPRSVRSVGIVGAGMMGTAIAAVNLKQRIAVTIADTSAQALAAAAKRILEELDGQMPAADARHVVDALLSPGDLADLGRCELIVESIVETLPGKLDLYGRLEPHLGAGTTLASNTSTIPIARLARGLADPGRLVGIHFFHPVRRRLLAEIIRGPQTEEATVAAAVAYAKQLGKLAIVVADGPGFLVNRLLLPYLNEALELLLDGVPAEEIEGTATRFGMAMGPLRLMDEIGLETALWAGAVLHEAFPDRLTAPPLIVAMLKAGSAAAVGGADSTRTALRSILPTAG